MTLTLARAKALPKIVLHEHYDCSIRGRHVLQRGVEQGTDIPVRFASAWRKAGQDGLLQTQAVDDYLAYLREHARMSLTNYLTILWAQVLPTLQTGDDIYRTAKERIDDAVDDGIIFLKLRFAPQLHRTRGLSLQRVIDPLQQACAEAPIPVRLAVCALRHENGRLGRHLADAVIRNKLITTFDLAGDESKYPGVLKWWARQARRVRQNRKKGLSCHIGETNAITDDDHRILDALGCSELGHGILGNPRKKLCTICLTSNIVTQVVENAAAHPIDSMYRQGRNINVDLDGMLLTGASESSEYVLISETFGWTEADFLRCNLNGLKYVPLSRAEKAKLERRLLDSYDVRITV